MRKKQNLLKEIILRISRITIVSLLSYLLYPYLIGFIKNNEEIIGFSFVLSTIIIYIIMFVINSLYFIIKKKLLGNEFDKKKKLVLFLTHFIIILMFIFFTIKTHDYVGTKYTLLILLGLELFGLLNSIYDAYTNNKNIIIENELDL